MPVVTCAPTSIPSEPGGILSSGGIFGGDDSLLGGDTNMTSLTSVLDTSLAVSESKFLRKTLFVTSCILSNAYQNLC